MAKKAKNRIAELREARGWSQENLAQAANTTNQQIGRLEAGERKLTVDWINRLAPALGVQPYELLITPVQVHVVGYVGAGSEAILYGYGQGLAEDDGTVPMPPGGTPQTVAVEVRGDSLGNIFNRWLVYYDDVRDPPTPELLNHLCVVGLTDGRVLVKKLMKGSMPGRHNLFSQIEGVIEDVEVAWAAKVLALTPK